MDSIGSYQDINPEQMNDTTKTIFIWLDILGFADALEDETRFLELARILQNFQSTFDSIISCHTTIISDGLLLRITNPSAQILMDTLKIIGTKQFEFITEHRIFIRGGIAIGSKLDDTTDTNNNLISQGLARAAKIEASSVDWPIIATNKTNIEHIQGYFGAEDELFTLKSCFNRKGEKIYFIDFLEEPNNDYYNILNDKVLEFVSSASVHSKYVWLLRYYHHKFPATLRDDRVSTEVVL